MEYRKYNRGKGLTFKWTKVYNYEFFGKHASLGKGLEKAIESVFHW